MIALLIPMALAAAPGAADRLLSTDADIFTLPNGLTVILEESHRTDRVSVHIRYGVGSHDEVDGEHGCAHLFEHLMFEGSKNVPQDKFDDWLTAAGGWNNAWTSEDVTAYHETFPAGAMDLTLFLESDRMGFLEDGVDEANVKNQQDVVLQERAEGYAQPHGRDWDAMSRLLFPPGHPYHVPVIGTVADVRGFQVESTRDFWRRHYRTQNATMAIVGHFDKAEARASVEHWFSDVPDRGAPVARPEPAPLPVTHQAGMLEDEIEDWGLWVAWPIPPEFDKDEPALEILTNILSYGRGTRLDDALYYDKRIAYETYAFTSTGDLGGALMIYAAATKPKIAKMKGVVDQVMAGIVTNPPTAAEIERARVAIRGDLLDSLEVPEGRAEWRVDCLVHMGTTDCLRDYQARYDAVTSADIVRVAQTFLTPDRQTTLSVVPKGKGGALPGATPVELP